MLPGEVSLPGNGLVRGGEQAPMHFIYKELHNGDENPQSNQGLLLHSRNDR